MTATVHALRPQPDATLPGYLPILVQQYLAHKTARGACINTIKAYGADLRFLCNYLARYDVTLVQLVSERLLDNWLDDMLQHLRASPRSAARRLACVRNFFQWCIRQRVITYDPCERVRVKFRPRRVVAPELAPLKAMIAGIGTKEAEDIRDRAMFLLLLDAGLRAGEVVRLDVVPDAFAEGKVRAPQYCVATWRSVVYVPHKGDERDAAPDVVSIETQTVKAVNLWLAVRGRMAKPGEQALFVNARGGRISRSSLWAITRRRGTAAGIDKLHPHLLRHRRLGDVIETLGLDAGRAHARHSSTATTAQIYGAHAAEVSRRQIREHCQLGEVG